MIDMQSISVAVTSLKTAGDIAKGLIGLHTMAEVQSKAIELNTQIIDAQHQIFAANATQTALVERIRELEREIARMEDWDAQKQRYKLASPFPASMVYALQESMSSGEPAHYLCAACFQKGQKSILQGRHPIHPKPGQGLGHATFVCPGCKSEATTQYMNIPEPKYAEEIPPRK